MPAGGPCEPRVSGGPQLPEAALRHLRAGRSELLQPKHTCVCVFFALLHPPVHFFIHIYAASSSLCYSSPRTGVAQKEFTASAASFAAAVPASRPAPLGGVSPESPPAGSVSAPQPLPSALILPSLKLYRPFKQLDCSALVLAVLRGLLPGGVGPGRGEGGSWGSLPWPARPASYRCFSLALFHFDRPQKPVPVISTLWEAESGRPHVGAQSGQFSDLGRPCLKNKSEKGRDLSRWESHGLNPSAADTKPNRTQTRAHLCLHALLAAFP